MKLAAVALMWSFPIDAATQAQLRARIEGTESDQVLPVLPPTRAK
jgi:hypothetical protein